MKCYVYKSSRRSDTYVYLAAPDQFASLPEILRHQLGVLSFVLELELTAERRLAQADAATVMANISDKGYYLQLPPDGPPTP